MLKPKNIERLPAAMVELYSQVEMAALAYMAERIMAVEDFIPASRYQYRKLIEMGNYHSYIVKALAALTGKTETQIKRLIRNAGQKSLRFDGHIYRLAGLDPPPLAVSPAIQTVMAAGLESTMGLFDNLTRTTANTSTRQFERALDRAWLQVSTGAFSHQEAVRMAVKELCSKGLASIEYPTGHTDYLDVAVRRAVLTGVHQTALKMQETIADELGCDLVEVTAHAGARTGVGAADHAGWQGKIYSRSGTHQKYPSLAEKTGYGTGPGLGGWNCRHDMFPFFEGISEPTYTKEELAELNAPKYEYNGKRLTEEETNSRQRYIERQIRRWRREEAAMKAAGLDSSQAASKLHQWLDTQKDFLEQTGLKRQFDREWVERPTMAANAVRNTGRRVEYNPNADFSITLDGYDKEVLAGLSRASAGVAQDGAADGLEHLRLVDLKTGEMVYSETGYADEVGGSNFWNCLSERQNSCLAFVHNHNTDGCFSEQDMVTLLSDNPVNMFVAVRLDGVRYIAEKVRTPANTFYFDVLYQDDMNALNQRVRDGIISAPERARAREELLVNNLLRDYTKGLIELE